MKTYEKTWIDTRRRIYHTTARSFITTVIKLEAVNTAEYQFMNKVDDEERLEKTELRIPRKTRGKGQNIDSEYRLPKNEEL